MNHRQHRRDESHRLGSRYGRYSDSDRSRVFWTIFYGKAANNYDVTLTVTLRSHFVTPLDPIHAIRSYSDRIL
jgi:hypothetical protein